MTPFIPGQTISSRGGVHVSNPQTDPPIPPDNGGLNVNCFVSSTGGNFEVVLEQQAVLNSKIELTVDESGVLTATLISSGFSWHP